MKLADKVLKGDVAAAARLIRCLEDEVPGTAKELESVYLHTGRAHIVGVTGAPGAGKSTLLGCLIGFFRKKGMKVGVVAVDPSSPFSGGAILGDRVRMQSYGVDKDVFIRSLATRGWKGGLAKATVSTIHVMDAMGKDVILVEAVGSGQGEVDIARVADTVILILTPGTGDEIQMMKAGILEAADIFVINKADIEGADRLKATLEGMLGMRSRSARGWKPGVVLTEAVHDKGIDEAADEILRHRAFLSSSDELKERRKQRARLELIWAIESYLNNYIERMSQGTLEKLVSELVQRKTNPQSAALKIISEISSGGKNGLFTDRRTEDA
jgi:LAO/AO transport system kinase